LQAVDTKFLKFLGQGNFRFVIPVYQRNYDWSIEQCEQLIQDLEGIITKNLSSYFIGSIVYISENQSVSLSNVNEIYVIDGQQRITTLTLLLIAIANMMSDEGHKKTIFENYILNSRKNDAEKIKLKPIKDDMAALSSIIRNEQHESDSSAIINYRFFQTYLASSKFSPEQIFDAIGKLQIVDISLSSGIDNPQLIFESLNSTGLDLSAADLIRNFILMNLTYERQEAFYHKYWRAIEKNCDYRTDDFIRHFITLKEGYIPTIKKVYKSFKNYRLQAEITDVETILTELCRFSDLFRQFETGKNDDVDISNALSRLKRLDNSVTYPYLLALFDDFSRGELAKEVVTKALQTVESYIVRRFVCNVQTNALNKIFMTLSRDIKKIDEQWPQRYVDYLSFVLLNKGSSGRFPNDSEVYEALKTKNIYSMKAKNKSFLFESLENFKNREAIDVYGGLENGAFSVEHIMPKTLTKTWKDDLGPDHRRIHEELLHTIGNLSLTAYNSPLQNKPFQEKKAIAFDDSRFWLNSLVKNQDRWNEEAILNRTRIISDRFMMIWPQIFCSSDISKVFDEEVPLSAEFVFTNRRIKAVTISEKHYEIDSYRSLKAEVLKYFYRLNASTLLKLKGEESFGGKLISNIMSDMKSPVEFETGIYTEGHMSAQSIVRALKKVAGFYNFDEDEITITLHRDARQQVSEGPPPKPSSSVA
jgi:uncharacterized protein with ParB-like and HNH nuclease domain